MFEINKWNHFRKWAYLHIDKLGESSLKHRSAIMFLSVMMFFIDPNVTLTFGSASLVGLGISVNPPQQISIGLFLLALLIYRLIAFWFSLLLENGTDPKIAERKAIYEFDPTHDIDEDSPRNIDEAIDIHKKSIIFKWTIRQFIWEIIIPNLLATISLVKYAIFYIS